jgi:putative transposase
MGCMTKRYDATLGRSGWVIALLNGLIKRLLQPARGSVVLASVTDLSRSKANLITENALLRQQLAIFNRQTKHPHLTTADRLSLLFFARMVKTWQQVLLIVQPATLLRWHRQGFQLFWKLKSRAGQGRQQLSDDTVELIRRMARENPLWGAERIRGELLKLGIRVAKRTIQHYMQPERSGRPAGQSWATCLKTHARDVWVCDFIPVIDLLFRHLYMFFIVELATRRVVHFGVTQQRSQFWVAQQLREATPNGEKPRFIVRDNDSKYGSAFGEMAKTTGIEVLRTPYRAPRANAIAERFVGSLRRECLDHLLIFSERQLYRVIAAYIAYFNNSRPHQGIAQRVPCGPPTPVEPTSGKIIAFSVLNSLHNEYRRAA